MTTDVDLPPAARKLLEETDWASLEHARGSAWDIPAALVQLLDEDLDVRRGAVRKLRALDGERLYSATAPAVLFAAAVLGDPRTLASASLPWMRPLSLRVFLIEWIEDFAAAVFDRGNHQGPTAVVDACRETLPELYAAVSEFFDDPVYPVRRAALGAFFRLGDDPRLAGRTPVEVDLPPAARAVLAGTDWGALEYNGASAADLPATLTLLLDEDERVRNAAFVRLDCRARSWWAPFALSAPVALFLAAIVEDPRTLVQVRRHADAADDHWPLRTALLKILGSMIERSCEGSRVEPSDEQIALRVALPGLYEGVAAFLVDPDPETRHTALCAARNLMKASSLADRLPETVRLLRSVLARSTDRAERVSIAQCLGEWHQDVSDLLDDRDPAVRACAALLAPNAADPRSMKVLLETLSDPAAVESWRLTHPSRVFGLPSLTHLLTIAVERMDTFDEMLPVLLPSLPYIVGEHPRPGSLPQPLADALQDGMFPRGLEGATELGLPHRSFLNAVIDLAGGTEATVRWLDGDEAWEQEWDWDYELLDARKRVRRDRLRRVLGLLRV